MTRLSLRSALSAAFLAAAPAFADGLVQTLQNVTPYADVAGGFEGEAFQPRPGQIENDRLSTQMISRFGLRLDVNDWIYVESELEADMGLHGSSAWEGQAALEVRNQLIRLHRPSWKVEVGRITDEASVDYFSANVVDMLLADPFTRDSLLYSGFNRGNGVLGSYEVLSGLKVGLTLNAGNPLATTATLIAGGPFPPFARYYLQPYQSVGLTPNHYPDDSFQLMEGTPSVIFTRGPFELKTALQLYYVNVDTTSPTQGPGSAAPITGRNLRVSSNLKLGPLRVFGNVAWNVNSMLNPTELKQAIPDQYQSLLLSGGVDFDVTARVGVGAQVAHVNFQPGTGTVMSYYWANVGATFWIADKVALGARFAYLLNRELDSTGPLDQSEQAVFVTLRTAL